MDVKYQPKNHEKRIYKLWEASGVFTPRRDSRKKPFTILLPPPNASGRMHTGNVLMIAIEDLLIRWKRMQGYAALWLPGTDHAGFETQTTFERELKKKGQSRFDYDRNTLYQKIMAFVLKNKRMIDNQMRQMGASVDWSRYSFMLDPHSLKVVTTTFQKMEKEGFIYRDNYLVNYSFKWGTTFSDAEITYKEEKTSLTYVRYPLIKQAKNEPKHLVVATVRPEPIFIDTHLAVNPKDSSKKWLVGRKVINPLTDKEMDIIADEFVDPKFGTGIVKLTPGHDKTDYLVAKKHGLEIKNIITLGGKLNKNAGKLRGLTIKEGRKKVIEILKEKGLVEKIKADYTHLVPVDYRSGDYIENLVLPNWFIKVEKLKKPAYLVVKKGEVKIYPKWREKTYLRWMETMHDWAISRQTVWGIRIPAWYSVKENSNLKITFLDQKGHSQTGFISELLKDFTFAEIESGLQTLIAPRGAKYIISDNKPGGDYLQETDTFDTWFSSGQWPLISLRYPNSKDFQYFYPTNVLETGWEIVTRWVSRMMMFGIYATGKPPFKDIYLHGHIKALDGKKMSKSLGNVINPEDYIKKFGVDALRMGLIAGTANGKDFNFPHDRVVAYRNFANKIWNMARFMLLMFEREGIKKHDDLLHPSKANAKLSNEDKRIIGDLKQTIKRVDFSLEKYRFADAGEAIYHFMWRRLASEYLEYIKGVENKSVSLAVFKHVYVNCLKLLHPFMPFVTETIWLEISGFRKNPKEMLISSSWPK